MVKRTPPGRMRAPSIGAMTADDQAVVDALEEIWASTVTACRGLAPEDWQAPTDCPGWMVRDHLSHVIGTERMLLGDAAPPPVDPLPEYVHNRIGEMNEPWVAERRRRPGDELVAEFSAVTARRLAELRGFGSERFDLVGWSPIGDVPYRQFMEIRAFDCWIHEQDIRRALGRPGGRGGAGEALTIARTVMNLPYVVGRRARAPEGSTVVWRVAGAEPQVVAVGVEESRGKALEEAPGDPTVSFDLDAETLWRISAGRLDPVDATLLGLVRVAGDGELGAAVLGAMPIVP